MEQSQTPVALARAAKGALGAVLIACTACCIALLAPVFAWLAVAGLAFTGSYGLVAGALGGALLAVVVYGWRRRRLQRQQCPCAPASSCKATTE